MAVAREILPPNEQGRMAAVNRYDILDTPPDGAFDRITRLASAILEVPIAIVSIVDHDRIWFKSTVGLDVPEIGREPGLCASAILGAEPWVVSAADVDPRALANPLVAGEFGLRFYAGVPLTTDDGFALGTLCVIDKEPREATPHQLSLLQDLAALVMDELELRLAARSLRRQATDLNDDVVQALTTAKFALQTGHEEQAAESLDAALGASKRILGGLIGSTPDLRRDAPAGTA